MLKILTESRMKTALNCNIVGVPTIDKNFNASGFSTSSYLYIPNEYKLSNATYVFKFTTGTISDSQCIVHSEYFLDIGIYGDSKIACWNWDTSSDVYFLAAEENTTYWFKVVINGTTKIYSYSTDGNEYTTVATVNDSKMDPTKTYQLRLGISSNDTTSPFKGSFDLNECYIEQSGEKVWTGTKEYEQSIVKLLKKTKYYKYTYSDHSLPVMTSATTPEGIVTTDAVIFENVYAYYAFFNINSNAAFNCKNNSSTRYLKYEFADLLKPATYTLADNSFRQQNVSLHEYYWVVIYEDDTEEKISDYTPTTAETTYYSTFTATKPIKAIKLYFFGSTGSGTYLNMMIKNISLTQEGKDENVVQMKSGAVESTIDDYDYAQNKYYL